jgi:ubiquinone biosynthesis protein
LGQTSQVTEKTESSSLGDRVAASSWSPLADTARYLERQLGSTREGLTAEAVALTQPGRVSPGRAIRHAAALGVHRAIRLGTRAPQDLIEGTPWRDPSAWAREAGIEAFVDQLALGGAPTAEVARLIQRAEGLFPKQLTDELAKRDIRAADLSHEVVTDVARRALGDDLELHPEPLAVIPVSQLHRATIDGRPAAVRVRRPGVARGVRDDTRLTASFITPLQAVLPQVSGVHPLGFVELTIRQGLESTDMRYEALNAIEIGLLIEELGIEGLAVARPLAGRVTRYAAAAELVEGSPIGAAKLADPARALASLVSVTLESALIRGVFWADPAPEHLVVTAEGELTLIGTGTVGVLVPTLKVAGIKFLRSFLSGDHQGQVDAMLDAGAVPDDADIEGLLDDLARSPKLQMSAILMGGEQGLLDGLNEAVRLMLLHRLRPPLEVTLLLRTVFALGTLSQQIDPQGGGLTMAVMPLVQKLPTLLDQAEA